MKIIKSLLLLHVLTMFIICCNAKPILSEARIIKNDGSKVTLTVKLKTYRGDTVLPDGFGNKYIRDAYSNKKINKSEIESVTLQNNQKYTVLKKKKRHCLGQIISEGRVSIFRAYTYSHSSLPSSGTTGFNSRHIVTFHPIYFKTHESIGIIKSKRKYIKALTKYCQEFKEYKNSNKQLARYGNFEKALIEFNSSCK